MKIIKLRLVGCTRLNLNNIKVFDYTPETSIQLILGTNGSGKSSVMNELSPLPADPADYERPGSKTIWIQHEGKEYKLTSTFEPKRVYHSFEVDGEEENEGGGVTIQRELVKKYFKYTQQLHELLTGEKRFSRMESGERRKWFTLLSDSRYDYVLGFYNRVSTAWRDIAGSIRTSRQRLVTETTKILPPEEHEALVKESASLHEALQELMSLKRPPGAMNYQAMEESQKVLARNLENTSKDLMKATQKLDRELGLEPEYLQERMLAARATHQVCTQRSNEYYAQHTKLAETLASLEKTHTQSIASIDVEIGVLEKEIAQLLEERKLPIERVQDPGTCLDALNASTQWLQNILEALPKNADKHYSRATFEEASKSLEQLKGMLTNYKSRIEEKSARIAHFIHLKSQGEIECPNCTHKWILNYDAVLHRQTEETLDKDRIARDATEKSIAEGEALVKSIRDYFQLYKSYQEVTSQWAILKPLWDYIQDSGHLLSNPTHVMNVVTLYKTDLAILLKVQACERQIAEKQQLMEITRKNAGLDYEGVKAQVEQLELTIHQNQIVLHNAQQNINRYKAHEGDLQEINRLLENIRASLESRETFYDEMKDALYQQFIQESIRHVQSMLARVEEALSASLNQNRVIEDIKKQIEDFERQERCLKLMVKEVSPTEGLIAEGIFGFMKVFVEQMNREIRKVWTYDLEVRPCELDSSGDVDLDYKFPLIVDGQAKADISKGSSAMKEIIDYAFRTSALEALHMRHYPLMLDEFGSTMDPTHKNATINLIQATMGRDKFSQLFMISHDVMQYGALLDTQVCVIHPANIIIPKDCVYNQHVVMQ